MAKNTTGVNHVQYLDANVFCLAALYEGPKADQARTLLHKTIGGDQPAITAALTLDEVAWNIGKAAGRDVGIRQATRLLGVPSLTVLDVKTRHMVMAFDLMETHASLRPRDAIHAAVALDAGVYSIVSDDDEFDVIPQLNRIHL